MTKQPNKLHAGLFILLSLIAMVAIVIGIRGISSILYPMEVRYVGQMNEVPIAWARERVEASDVPALRVAFEALYQQRYGEGTFRRETPLEIISFHAEAVKTTEMPAFAPLFEGKRGATAPGRRRPVYMRGRGFVDAGVYAFDDLSTGVPITGPAIIERESTTIWLPPGTRATLDVYGNLAIDVEA